MTVSRRIAFISMTIEVKLKQLIREHGGRPTDSGPTRPAVQSFAVVSFLASDDSAGILAGNDRVVSDLRHPESYGEFEPKVFRLLKSSTEARSRVVDSILNEWWPETLHGDIARTWGSTGWTVGDGPARSTVYDRRLEELPL